MKDNIVSIRHVQIQPIKEENVHRFFSPVNLANFWIDQWVHEHDGQVTADDLTLIEIPIKWWRDETGILH